jgi:hypothetical protein
LVYSRETAKCQRKFATQVRTKQANRSQHDRMTPVVRPMKQLMAWTLPLKHCGTRQKIRLAAPVRTMLRRRPYLIAPIERRKSEGGWHADQKAWPNHRNADRSAPSRTRPVDTINVGGKHRPGGIGSWRRLVGVLPNLTAWAEMHNATKLETMLGGVGLAPDRAIPR